MIFSRFPYRTNVLIGMALFNPISLMMFQSEMKVYPTILPVSLPGHKCFKKCALYAIITVLATIIHIKMMLLDG